MEAMSDPSQADLMPGCTDSVLHNQMASRHVDLNAVTKQSYDSMSRHKCRHFGACNCHKFFLDFFLLRMDFPARDSSKSCSGLIAPILLIAVRVASPKTAAARAIRRR